MVSPVLYENWPTAGFLVSEANNYLSRGLVTFDNTAGALDLLVQGGTVFSYAAPGTPIASPAAGNTGNGTVSGASANTTTAELGAYVVTMLTATSFSVTAPDGGLLKPGVAGTPYADGIGFTLTAGGTPFVAGDGFTVTLATGAAPAVAAKAGGNTGNGAITAVEQVQSATAILGNYTVIFTGALTYDVVAPDGRKLTSGRTGTAYQDEIAFLITAGGTAFASGDQFTIGLPAGSGLVTAYTGASPAGGIVYNKAYVPAGGTLQVTAIQRMAEVNRSEVQFAAGVPAAAQATAFAQLALLGILAR